MTTIVVFSCSLLCNDLKFTFNCNNIEVVNDISSTLDIQCMGVEYQIRLVLSKVRLPWSRCLAFWLRFTYFLSIFIDLVMCCRQWMYFMISLLWYCLLWFMRNKESSGKEIWKMFYLYSLSLLLFLALYSKQQKWYYYCLTLNFKQTLIFLLKVEGSQYLWLYDT